MRSRKEEPVYTIESNPTLIETRKERNKDIILSETDDASRRTQDISKDLDYLLQFKDNPLEHSEDIRSTLINIAYGFHVIDLETGHASKLRKKAPVDVPNVNISAVVDRYDVIVRSLMKNMTDQVMGDDYKSVKDAIFGGLISPDQLVSLESIINQAQNNLKKVACIADQPEIMVGDLTTTDNALEKRFLSVDETGHAITTIYYQKNPIPGRSRGIYTGLKRESDILKIADKEIDVRNLRVDKVPIMPRHRKRSVARTLKGIMTGLQADKSKIREIASQYEDIIRYRQNITAEFTRKVRDIFAYSLDESNLVDYEGKLIEVKNLVSGNSWLAEHKTEIRQFNAAQNKALSLRSRVDKAYLVRSVLDSFNRALGRFPNQIDDSYNRSKAKNAMSMAEDLLEKHPWLEKQPAYSLYKILNKKLEDTAPKKNSSLSSIWD